MKRGYALVIIYVWEHRVNLNYRIVWWKFTKLGRDKEKKEEIWLSPMTKAPTPTEMSKGQSDNTNNATKNSIKQRLRTDLGRSVGVTTATQLVWLTVLMTPHICVYFWTKSAKGWIQGRAIIGEWGALLQRNSSELEGYSNKPNA